MPTRSSGPPQLLVDTSIAVALVVVDHADHAATIDAIGTRRLGLAGHAAFEAYSVLTRLPPPARRTPRAVSEVLATNFPENRYLSAGKADRLLGQLAAMGVAGGAVYDALVGAAALEHRMVLATRDRRALETYRLLGVDVEVL